jgi:hypothetical protein
MCCMPPQEHFPKIWCKSAQYWGSYGHFTKSNPHCQLFSNSESPEKLNGILRLHKIQWKTNQHKYATANRANEQTKSRNSLVITILYHCQIYIQKIICSKSQPRVNLMNIIKSIQCAWQLIISVLNSFTLFAPISRPPPIKIGYGNYTMFMETSSFQAKSSSLQSENW